MQQPNVQPSSRSTPSSVRDAREEVRGLDEHEEHEERARLAAEAEPARQAEPSFGTSFLEGNTEDSWQRWRDIQSSFVDEPRSAVGQANQLVSELIDGIVRRFESEREELEKRWSSGEDVSTEELRRCLQRYRDFFGRLLANLNDARN